MKKVSILIVLFFSAMCDAATVASLQAQIDSLRKEQNKIGAARAATLVSADLNGDSNINASALAVRTAKIDSAFVYLDLSGLSRDQKTNVRLAIAASQWKPEWSVVNGTWIKGYLIAADTLVIHGPKARRLKSDLSDALKP